MGNSKHSAAMSSCKPNTRWQKILAPIFIGFSILMTVPWQPPSFSYALDDSYTVVLNEAFANNIQFGKEFIYTYGPLGFMQYPRYFSETYSILVTGRLFIGLTMGIGLFRIFTYCWNKHKWSTLFLVPFLFWFPNSGIGIDSFYIIFTALPLLLYFYVDQGNVSPSLILTIVGISLAALIKQTYFTLGLALIILITIDQGLRRRPPIVLATYLLCALVFWIFAGQEIGNIGAYFTNASQIVKGFSRTMGIPGSLSEIITYSIGASAFFVLTLVTTWRRTAKRNLLPIVGLSLILFLTFKGAFVRHDFHHAMQSIETTLPIVGLYSALLAPIVNQPYWKPPILWSLFKTKIHILSITWVLLLFHSTYTVSHYTDQGYLHYYAKAVNKTVIAIRDAFLVSSGRADLQTIQDSAFQQIREANPLPKVTGTTDLYPNDLAVIVAYDLPYQPRPIIQSFSAYTAELAELNAAHLRNENAPETILFKVASIDNRLPSSADGLSWPELLTRYNITDVTGAYLVLKRRNKPSDYKFSPLLQEKTLQIGEWVDVPTGNKSSAIWMQANAQPSLFGKVLTTLFRQPQLRIELEFADGSSGQYRVLDDVMRAGQLLSPQINHRQDFAYLAGGIQRAAVPSSDVKRMRLTTGYSAKLAYSPSYTLNLSQLNFPAQDLDSVPGWSNFKDFLPLRKAEVSVSSAIRPQMTNSSDGRTVFLAHADTRLIVFLPTGSQQLSVEYGILDGAWQNAAKAPTEADGVEFRIVANYPDGQENVLFSQWLDPHENEEDRGQHHAVVDLTSISIGQISLETLSGPAKNNFADWSYWEAPKLD